MITHVIYTWGELCLSPVGLSMVARYSLRLESGEWTFVVEGLGGFYLLLALVPIGVGCVILLRSPWLRRWMHGVH